MESRTCGHVYLGVSVSCFPVTACVRVSFLSVAEGVHWVNGPYFIYICLNTFFSLECSPGWTHCNLVSLLHWAALGCTVSHACLCVPESLSVLPSLGRACLCVPGHRSLSQSSPALVISYSSCGPVLPCGLGLLPSNYTPSPMCSTHV